MTFEEDFPSLVKYVNVAKKINGGFGNGLQYETISRYCLDKQRVKDAIDKIISCNCEDLVYSICPKCKLKEEKIIPHFAIIVLTGGKHSKN